MSDHAWSTDHITAYVAGGLSAEEAERLENHARDCSICTEAIADARRLDRGLSNLFATARPAPTLEDGLIRTLRTGSVRKPFRVTGWPTKAIWATAASVGLGAVGFLGSRMAELSDLPFPGMQQTASRINRETADQPETEGYVRSPAFNGRSGATRWREEDERKSPSPDDFDGVAKEDKQKSQSEGESAVVRNELRAIDPESFAHQLAQQNTLRFKVANGSVPSANPSLSYSLDVTQPPSTTWQAESKLQTMGELETKLAVPLYRGLNSTTDNATREALSSAIKEVKDNNADPDKVKKLQLQFGYITPQDYSEKFVQKGDLKQGGVNFNPPVAGQSVTQTTKPALPAADPNLPSITTGSSTTQPPAPTPAPDPAPTRKIIRSGDIEFEVESFDAAVATVSKLIAAITGAFVATVNSEKLPNGKVKGSVVVRVPPEHLDTLVLDLRRELGKVRRTQGPADRQPGHHQAVHRPGEPAARPPAPWKSGCSRSSRTARARSSSCSKPRRNSASGGPRSRRSKASCATTPTWSRSAR